MYIVVWVQYKSPQRLSHTMALPITLKLTQGKKTFIEIPNFHHEKI
jgi:hypothetical protein